MDETLRVEATGEALVEPPGAAALAPVEPVEAERPLAAVRPRAGLRERLIALALLVALVGGAYFRFVGLDWDRGQHLHPDERFITIVSTTWRPAWSLDEYFDNTRNPLNPYNYESTSHFVYGPVPLMLAMYTSVVLNTQCDALRQTVIDLPLVTLDGLQCRDGAGILGAPFSGYDAIYLVGRAQSALTDLLSVFVLFLLARRLYGGRVAALASLLAAGAVMLIQQSHFYTVDATANLFVVLAMYFAVRGAQDGRARDYALFGLAGAAALASRINTAPLLGMIAVAAGLWALRRLDAARAAAAELPAELPAEPPAETPPEAAGGPEAAPAGVIAEHRPDTPWSLEPEAPAADAAAVAEAAEPAEAEGPDALWWLAPVRQAVLLVIVAAVVTVIGFRVLQPYAFGPQSQPTGLLNIFYTAEEGSGGPPLPFINPAWWRDLQSGRMENSGEIDSPPGKQWANRTPIVFPWLNIVLWGLGLPLGLAAWAGWAAAGWQLARAGSRPERREVWHRHLLPFVWVTGYFLFMGLQHVKSMRYMVPIYPFLALFAAWALVALWDWSRQAAARATLERAQSRLATLRAPALAGLLIAVVLAGTWGWAWAFTRIYTRPVTREAASRWIFQNVPTAATVLVASGSGVVPQQVPIPPGFHLAEDGINAAAPFTVSEGGVLSGVRLNYLVDPQLDAEPETLRVVVSADPAGSQIVAEGMLEAHAETGAARGAPFEVALGGNTFLVSGRTYYLLVYTVAGAPVQFNTSHLANESWDDPLPLRVDGKDGFGGWYRGLTPSEISNSDQMQPYWEDDERKRTLYQQNIDDADYIILSSSRAAWSVTRLPVRYPLMVTYYQALMDGSLGFDLVGSFHSAPNIGPLRINDVTAEVNLGDPLPLPRVIDQPYFSAEEAFNVYDHPPVWIFKKNPERYRSENTAAILNGVDLSQVVWVTPREAGRGGRPSLVLDAARWAADRAGGTWSEMFSRTGPLNQFAPLAIATWWLFMLVVGWIAFPLLFVATGKLPDRGYPLAKIAALLLLSWAAWFLGSYRILPFTRWALVGLVAVLVLASAAALRARQAELLAYVRERRRLIVIVEVVTFVFFLAFVAVRWQNPDLWHPNFGGEKPMDFAYLNAVIKTTYFPPYDPWFAGGYINYYYYGFVLAAVPIKLLGVLPAVAYNLILPTLFALTAIGAFSAAYNLVAYGRERAAERGEPDEDELPEAAAAVEPIPGEPGEAALAPVADRPLDGLPPDAPLPSLPVAGSWLQDPPAYPWEPAPAAELAPTELAPTELAPAELPATELPASAPARAPAETAIAEMEIAEPAIAETPAAEVPMAEAPAEEAPAEEAPAAEPVAFRAAPRPWTLSWRAVVAGLLAALLVSTLGNLGQAKLILEGWERIGLEGGDPAQADPGPLGLVTKTFNIVNGLQKSVLGGQRLPYHTGQWYWDATRVINFDPGEPGPISEFPYFTFLYADLHAHMIALPLTLLALGLALAWATAAPDWDLAEGGSPLARARAWLRTKGLLFALLALAVGVLRPTNTWDWPTYLAISAAAFVFAEVRRAGRITVSGLATAALESVALVAISSLLYLPFSQTYAQAYSSAEAWNGSTTELTPYLVVHGLFLFVLATFLLHELLGWLRALLRLEEGPLLDILAAAALGALVLIVMLTIGLRLREIFVAPVAVPLIGLAALATLRPSLPGAPVAPMRRAAAALATLALTLTLVVEIVVLKGDVGRMNTVFKFYLQVWVLFGVTAGAALAWLWPRVLAWPSRLRVSWTAVLAVLFAAVLLYPLTATQAKIEDRWVPTAPEGLDGMAFMELATYADNNQNEVLRYDYDALRWIQDNLPGSPVIAEAPAGPSGNPGLYHWASRVATYTGNPTIVGWDWHQRQQRAAASEDVVGRRTQDAMQLFVTPDPSVALEIARQYDVEYIYVGPVETVFYPAESLAKFERMAADGTLRLVYQNDGVRLYQIVAGE